MGHVLPIELGQEGVIVEAGPNRWTIAAGVPGDRVRIRPSRTEEASVVRLEQASEDRTIPPCSLLDQCGGCSLQAMRYPSQLQAKTNALRNHIACLGKTDCRVTDIVGLSSPFGYRTKLLMTADESNRLLSFGFYHRGTMNHICAEGCPVQHPLALGVLAMAKQVFIGQGIKSWLHGLAIRVDPQNSRSELIVVGQSPRFPGGQTTIEQLAQIPSLGSVFLCAAEQRSSYLLTPPFKRLAGHRRMRFHLGKKSFLLSPGTFFQTSKEGAEHLVEQVRSLLPQRVDLLIDLYAGSGILALLIRDRWRRAIAVESNPSAVDDLKHLLNEKDHSATKLSVVSSRVELRIHELLSKQPDLVVLDPPRRGCHPEVIDALLHNPPQTIIYVACGFDAFIKQTRRLINGRYRLSAVTGVDMFPHTAHLEVIAKLERKNN